MTKPGRLTALLSFLLLAACGGDPVTQEPVNLEPGLYAVSYTGATNMPFGGMAKADSGLDETVCVTQAERDRFLHGFPRRFFSKMAPSCQGSKEQRMGNRLSGTITCIFAEGPAGGNMSFAYEGDVAPDSLSYRAKMGIDFADPAQNADTDVFEDLELRLDLKRTGDCPA